MPVGAHPALDHPGCRSVAGGDVLAPRTGGEAGAGDAIAGVGTVGAGVRHRLHRRLVDGVRASGVGEFAALRSGGSPAAARCSFASATASDDGAPAGSAGRWRGWRRLGGRRGRRGSGRRWLGRHRGRRSRRRGRRRRRGCRRRWWRRGHRRGRGRGRSGGRGGRWRGGRRGGWRGRWRSAWNDDDHRGGRGEWRRGRVRGRVRRFDHDGRPDRSGGAGADLRGRR